jgi:hypothetical protein
MTQREVLRMTGLLNTNHGSRIQAQIDLGSAGDTAIELGDVGYIHHNGTFVKLFNASKGFGDLATGHDRWWHSVFYAAH